MKFTLFFIAVLPTSFSKTTYQLTFPDSTNKPHVKFVGTIDHPLTEYTLCHWTKVNGILPKWGAIFSYVTPQQFRAITTWIGADKTFHVDQNQVVLNAKVIGQHTFRWVHTCVSSFPLIGRWDIYINGVGTWAGTSSQGKPIPSNGTVVLGQDQKAEGGFIPNYEFIGHIADVLLWDRALDPKEIAKVYACEFTDEANVINWNLHSWRPSDGVLVSRVNLPCGQ